MPGLSHSRFHAATATRITAFLILAILLSLLSPHAARAQTEPVQFTLSGTIETTGPVPLDHAQLIIFRTGTSELLANRVFSAANGSFSANFQAEVIPNVDLDDPIIPPGAAYSGFWMGDAWPNPYQPGQGRGITLPFAAPSHIQSRPDLEMFDTRGRRVRTGELMASGIYFYRLRFEGRVTEARKLVLLGATRIQLDLRRVESPDVGKPTFDGAARSDGSAARRAEGTIDVDIAVVKPGYVTQFITTTLESRINNQVNATLAVEPVPSAQLSITGSLTQGEAVLYDGLGSIAPDGQNLTYSWDFGDGVHGGGQLVAHVYAQPGMHTVELTVSSTYGATAKTSQTIDIVATPPAATDATTVGTMRDAIGNLLEGVTVTLVGGAATGLSDGQGLVSLTGLPTGIPFALRCDKSGYTLQIIRMILPVGTTTSEFRATLRQQRSAVPIASVEDGAALEGEDGVRIELPADALQKLDGTPATGAATIRMTPVDVMSEIESAAFPGSYEGVLTDGQRGLIVSYGTAEFVIKQGGEELQLRPGSRATVEIPVYTPGSAVDDVIALWSVDETTGLWTEEGTGVIVSSPDSPTGLALRAAVTHLSWWNCDDFLGAPYRPIPECKIKDQFGLPTLDIPVGGSCYIEGQLLIPNGPTSRPYINIPAGGGIPLLLPPNLDVQLTASTNNGTKVGILVVNGASDVSEVITIALDDPSGTPGELQLPVDIEATIDPVGDIDRYTFEATVGQYFNVFVAQGFGSTLEGDLRVFAPDDTELRMSSFGGLSTSFAHEVIQAGTYTIEVDGTANEPGAYHMVVGFAEAYELTIPSFVDENTQPGRSHVFLVSATAGEWFSVNYLRRENIGFGNVGFLRVEDPSGAVVFDLNFNSNVIDTGLIQANETGLYRVFLTSSSIDSAYTLFVRDVPELVVGGTLSGSADERSTRYFRFAADQDDFLRSALDPVVNFTGSLGLLNGNGAALPGQFVFGVQSGTYPTVIPATGEYFVRLVASFTPVRTLRDYRVSLNDILAPEVLTFDSAGRGQVLGGQIGLFGDARFYQFSATAGSGVAVELNPGGVSTLGIGATTQIYRIGTGSATNPNQRINEDSLTNHPGLAPMGILEYGGYLLPDTDTYLVMVTAPAPEDGAFDLVVDVVAPSSNLTVDDDLLSCPGADTRSLVAATMAAPAGATINICAGDYAYIVPIPMTQPGLQLVGSAANEVTLRHRIRGTVIFAQAASPRIANLTVEPIDPIQSTGIWLANGSGAIVEDVIIRASVATSDLRLGIDLGTGNSDITIRRVRFENSGTAIGDTADRVLIEECQFEGGSGMVDISGNEITVRNNTWNCDAIGQVMKIDIGAGHQIVNNQITILTTDIGAGLGTEAMWIEDDDAAGTLPTTVISGNQITTNEAGFDLRVNRAGSAIICEQNFVQMTARGQTAVVVIPLRDAGADVLIQNNVFDGLYYFEGVHLRWADWYGSLRFLNNTMRTDTQGLVQATYPTIRVDLRTGTFTGALPVLLVNNVLQGPSGGIAVQVPLNTTIDSDYNLFDAYATYYNDGTTSTGLNDLTAQDPLFVGALLELDPASPGVDSGAGTGDVAEIPVTDYAGGTRPQGGGTDRGAHEQ